MLATAWDEGTRTLLSSLPPAKLTSSHLYTGLDLFASASPAAGEKWCLLGLKIARTLEGVGVGEEVESGLAKQVRLLPS